MSGEQKQSLFVAKVVDNDDGTSTIEFQYDASFKKWFLESQKLKRWSQKRFEKVIKAAIEEYATSTGKTVTISDGILDPEEEN
tara:strand:- start:37 stop:285 length:249 start_codon:yes stop_codon:yes gene_type:complete